MPIEIETSPTLHQLQEMTLYDPERIVMGQPDTVRGFWQLLQSLPWEKSTTDGCQEYEGTISGPQYSAYLTATKTTNVVTGSIRFPADLVPPIKFTFLKNEPESLKKGVDAILNTLEKYWQECNLNRSRMQRSYPIAQFLSRLTACLEIHGLALIIEQKSSTHPWFTQFLPPNPKP